MMRLRICRKEAKESSYWLKMIKNTVESIDQNTINILIGESIQLKKIFSSIIDKIEIISN
jgi:four helix bundle protein